MAKANLGTKRVCPETGRKFYDLDKDPIVSPYTGNEYPLSFFEEDSKITAPKPDEAEEAKTEEAEVTTETETEDVTLEEDGPEIISLDEAEEDTSDDDDDSDEEIPDIPDMPDVDIDEDGEESDDDTFLEDDDEDDDLSDVIVRSGDDEEL